MPISCTKRAERKAEDDRGKIAGCNDSINYITNSEFLLRFLVDLRDKHVYYIIGRGAIDGQLFDA